MAATAGIGLPTISRGYISVGFGTAIVVVVAGHPKGRTKISKMAFTCSTTAHTLTAMTELSRTTVIAVVAASAATFNIKRDPGMFAANNKADSKQVTQSTDVAIAAGHFYIVRLPDRSWFQDTVSSCVTNSDGTVTITPTATIPTGGFLAGATFWFYGALTSKNPANGLVHAAWKGTASAQLVLGDDGGSVVESFYRDSPIILSDNNATATGSIDYVTGIYA
jgi:hypothetical protein